MDLNNGGFAWSNGDESGVVKFSLPFNKRQDRNSKLCAKVMGHLRPSDSRAVDTHHSTAFAHAELNDL